MIPQGKMIEALCDMYLTVALWLPMNSEKDHFHLNW